MAINLQNQSSATPVQNAALHQPLAGVSQFEVQAIPSSGVKAVGRDSGDTLCNLLKLIGEAFRLQSTFLCAEAEQQYKKLTSKQKETGWI